ncbi:MAG: Rossman fold protein, TIGR00730 family [Candidatus Yanofskybacteria bacterium RIFCSPHIGHO2_02_FULL_41_29]|uniref:Cytokinin riboside 5'-monophosphate phosphoribohydrolase n=1 Tax=Candidatus Yanofskybacteria bacterium RIFCSPHIGHO2_01_FULL_41_53 TaxID=1802663 RepID=A0A1F8EJ29_9BACT|nr:MAG: Rossman fold protein, TIGR00730 family [Candidatus Yanofskybacteria bacterium RIFCSPHIGHO2_01_FULL_41_53]OGN12361.1 MAG: Rossman fold protein, TIGR00730 family [Candidatus Yanofskybacteria bacterium RIFCSPHIGHO2_02_FULL_41_29]OGN17202.1 MAG: Rossman fold protein, TIGR00730 family [Candidatus Yanofskybacteria bacterium RIFCSPHIGHO2_12_FULL_41_9]OGN23227.1 MAG: Rossman fold protein, TIGR00730 family [Candidatus Yanofskybacteria bacterium RIFCSPLOWO2_01_FULL_41_67]OGN28876.1 MAG: Rossman f
MKSQLLDSQDDLIDRRQKGGFIDAGAINNWRIFRIMAEFVEGWQFLSHYNKKVTIFGSARSSPESKWYKEAVKLGKMLAEDGFDIVTGGGPGIMEAANRGASDASKNKKDSKKIIGESIGLDIQLPLEQRKNKYVQKGRGFYYFFVRKVMLSYHSRGYVFFPGGYGTLDEVFELLTLVQTNKLDRVPIILAGKDYWNPLLDWLKTTVFGQSRNISKEDLDIYSIVDTAEEIYSIIKKSVNKVK